MTNIIDSRHSQRVFEGVVQLHDGRLVATAIAVVGGAKYRHHIPLVAPVVALNGQTHQSVCVRRGRAASGLPYLHDQLVGSGHQREAVGVVEGLRDVLAKRVAGPPGGDAPAAAVIRVRPQQVAHGALQRGGGRNGAAF